VISEVSDPSAITECFRVRGKETFVNALKLQPQVMYVFQISTICQIWSFNVDEKVLIRDVKKYKRNYIGTQIVSLSDEV